MDAIRPFANVPNGLVPLERQIFRLDHGLRFARTPASLSRAVNQIDSN